MDENEVIRMRKALEDIQRHVKSYADGSVKIVLAHTLDKENHIYGIRQFVGPIYNYACAGLGVENDGLWKDW